MDATSDRLMAQLRDAAMSHPEVSEGIACAGTPIESRTLKVGRSAFVFLRSGQARLKLADSLPEAIRLQELEPGHYQVGSKGWVKVNWSVEHTPPLPVLKGWIAESYRLMAKPAIRK